MTTTGYAKVTVVAPDGSRFTRTIKVERDDGSYLTGYVVTRDGDRVDPVEYLLAARADVVRFVPLRLDFHYGTLVNDA